MQLLRLIFSLLVVLAAIGLNPVVSHTAAQDQPIKFQFDLSRPVFRHGGFGDWDSRHTAPGAVVFHDGLFHMFRNGYRGWPLPSQIGYLTSEDGVSWTEAQLEPVFTHDQIPFEVDMALLTSAVVEADGGWSFYFTLFPPGNPNRPSGIVRATASDPLSPWDMDERILLLPGSAGEWDAKFIAISKVLLSDNQYVMYYAAESEAGDYAIGRATSADGISWTKYDNPATQTPLLASSDPVFTREADWEINIQDPRVVFDQDGWVMLYSSFDGSFRNQGYGIALSEDGIHWERLQNRPVLARAEIGLNPWYPELVAHDGTYYFYLEADAFDGGTNIYLSTFQGSLRSP